MLARLHGLTLDRQQNRPVGASRDICRTARSAGVDSAMSAGLPPLPCTSMAPVVAGTPQIRHPVLTRLAHAQPNHGEQRDQSVRGLGKARTFGCVQARPRVTLVVQSGKIPAPDVLDSGGRFEPRLTPAARRRLQLGIVVIIVSLAAVAGVSGIHERRVAAAEARRLAGLWQLSADGPYGFGLEADPPASLSAVMDMTISLRNDGPQDVTVTSASAGGFVLLAPVLLPAQTRREFVMHQTLDCTADTLLPSQPPLNRTTSGPLKWPGLLQVTARTARDTRTITFARPPYDSEHAAVICDWLRSGRPERSGGAATTDPP